MGPILTPRWQLSRRSANSSIIWHLRNPTPGHGHNATTGSGPMGPASRGRRKLPIGLHPSGASGSLQPARCGRLEFRLPPEAEQSALARKANDGGSKIIDSDAELIPLRLPLSPRPIQGLNVKNDADRGDGSRLSRFKGAREQWVLVLITWSGGPLYGGLPAIPSASRCRRRRRFPSRHSSVLIFVRLEEGVSCRPGPRPGPARRPRPARSPAHSSVRRPALVS